MKCAGTISTACDGADVRPAVIWPSMRRTWVCGACRRAARAMGLDVRIVQP